MAITKIHPITGTVAKSIKYISNGVKTDDERLISFYGCVADPDMAAFAFKNTLDRCERAGKNKAYHLIQSFYPGEVDDTTANLIGRHLASKVLGGKYSYVLATHNDRNHIHNHIIFCAADNITHKKYHASRTSYYEIRHASDELCKEFKLSTISPTGEVLKSSHSYLEWDKKRKGTSYKTILRRDIKSCLEYCPSYPDFIKRMIDKGYEIKGINSDEGAYISFKVPSSFRWIRGKESTLGKEYTRESIISFINDSKKKIVTKTERKIREDIKNISSKKVLSFIDTDDDKFNNNDFLKVWAERENLKRLAHNYTTFRNSGFTSLEEVDNKISNLEYALSSKRSKIVSLERNEEALGLSIKAMEDYLSYKKYNDIYRSSRNKEAVLLKYERQLILFDGARNDLKEYGISLKLINEDFILKEKDKYQDLCHEKNLIYDDINKIIKEIKDLKMLESTIYSSSSSPLEKDKSIDKSFDKDGMEI